MYIDRWNNENHSTREEGEEGDFSKLNLESQSIMASKDFLPPNQSVEKQIFEVHIANRVLSE